MVPVLGLERYPGGRNGSPPQYSCLGNPMDRGAWWAAVHCCSVAKSCLTLCDPMDCSMTGFSVLHYFPEFDQTHVHLLKLSDAIQPSHPLSPSSAFNLSQHQGLFQ